jgi:hypothetical protein
VVKRLECEFGHLTPYTALVKNVWSNTSGRHICLQVLDRNKFTFLYSMDVGNSISKLQIQVATYVFELSAGNYLPLDGSTI